MKYYSEELKTFFNTEKECEKAEQAYFAEVERQKAVEAKKDEARKARAKEVDEAYNALKSARKKYNDLLAKFCEDYGAYHTSFTSEDAPSVSSLLDFFF